MKNGWNHPRLMTALLILGIAWIWSGPALAESPAAVQALPAEEPSKLEACDSSKSLIPELPTLVFSTAQASQSHQHAIPFGRHKEDLNDYCDTSPNHGTSSSCEDNLTIPAGTCAGRNGSSGCSKVGQACAVAGSPGTWCQNCYVWCISDN